MTKHSRTEKETIKAAARDFFVVELQIFCRGQDRVKSCQAISLPHTS